MKHAIEYTRCGKEDLKVLQKINSVSRHEVVLIPHKLVGVNGRHLMQRRREVKERSNTLWKGGKIHSKKPTKVNIKVWEEFVQWVRHKNITSVKDFQQYYESK